MRLNRDARKICKEVVDRIVAGNDQEIFVHICGAFLQKATETLSAVNVLYAHNLKEPAQALIRILFELRINFDCFLSMSSKDGPGTAHRVIDSMMLEKIKQARASGFMGMSDEDKSRLENTEQEIASKYAEADFRTLRKNGFTGLPVEQRASLTGHEAAYSVVYRNFSRNIHSTDYVESYMKAGIYPEFDDDDGYIENRDIVAHYVAHFSAVGMAEFANGILELGLEKELLELANRQIELKDRDRGSDT